MLKYGKKYQNAVKLFDIKKLYDPEEAIELLKKIAVANFDETIELAVRLGVDPKHAEQQVRGAVVLPHGTGKSRFILVFAKGEKAKEAELAGANIVGAEDIITKIQSGWLDFDVAVATPDMMGLVGKLGKLLGPKGLMPNPKVGTVTTDITRAVNEIKAGKIEYKIDKSANIHVPLGKVSFENIKLIENFYTVLNQLVKVKPSTSKGQYLRSITLCTTMGPGIKINSLKVTNKKE